jgi:indole-3-glycerol phosphate synthase
MGFLTDLVAGVRRDLATNPPDDAANLARASVMPPPRDFEGSLRAGVPAVIAEVKRASPSAGAIAEGADAVQLGRAYASGGAAAISVLTEPRHFHGSLADLRSVRAAVDRPVLRKDFLVHPSQLIESRAAGADAVLLIAAALPDREIDGMLAAARDLGLGVLLEIHSDDDLRRALDTDAEVIGVNARDLESLEVELHEALRRLARIPNGRLAVLESGVRARADVEAAVEAGASAVLVGEALMRAADPAATIRELLAVGSPAR